MNTEKVIEMLKEKFSSISKEKQKPVADISLLFTLRDFENFNVFLDTIPGEEIDILAEFKVPLIARLLYNRDEIVEKIHGVVAATLVKLADLNGIEYQRTVAKMRQNEFGELTLFLMNGYDVVKPISVTELFELNE